jgi:hypothetical protein
VLWIEVHDTLLDHRKLRRLERLTGVPCVYLRGHLVTLWLSVLRHRPDGILTDWEPEDFDFYANWQVSQGHFGTRGTLRDSLIKSGFVDCYNNVDEIADWAQYSGTLKLAQRRQQERERKSAYRLRKRGPKEKVSQGQSQMSPGQPGTVPRVPKCPNGTEQNRTERNRTLNKDNKYEDAVRRLAGRWLAYFDPGRRRVTKKHQQQLAARLKAGWTEGQLTSCIDYIAKDPWHIENGQVRLDLACRSDEQVERCLAKLESGPGRGKDKRELAVARSMEHFLG